MEEIHKRIHITQSDLFHVEDFLTIVIGIVRIGIRLFGFLFKEFGDDMTSFDTDRRIVDVFFGLIHGIDV